MFPVLVASPNNRYFGYATVGFIVLVNAITPEASTAGGVTAADKSIQDDPVQPCSFNLLLATNILVALFKFNFVMATADAGVTS